MSQVRKALLYSAINQYAFQIISFVSVAILARLLTPEEIGIFAVASSIAFLATSLRSLGVSEYLVREKAIDQQKVRSVVGLMIIMSWGLAFILIIAAAWIADFYQVPDIRNILWIITLPFFIAPFSSVPFALLAREMKFDAILRIDLAGNLTRNGVSIGLALLDYGYYGLAYGTLAGIVAEFLATLYYRPATMVWTPSFKQMGDVVKLGIPISVSRLFYMTSQNSTDLVLGRMATMNDVGLFSRGLGLIMFLNGLLAKAVGPVTLPHLSQVKRDGGSVRDAYLESITLMGAFALPLFAAVNLSSHSLITAMFGDQWQVSVSLASTLAIWAMLQSVYSFAGSAFVAIGKEKYVLVQEAVSFSVKIAAIILAVPYGLEFVAYGFIVSGAVDMLVVGYLLRQTLGLAVIDVIRSFVPNIIVAANCWIVLKVASIYLQFENMNSWLALLIIACLMVPVWLVSLRLTNNRAWPFVQSAMMKVLKFRFGQGSAT